MQCLAREEWGQGKSKENGGSGARKESASPLHLQIIDQHRFCAPKPTHRLGNKKRCPRNKNIRPGNNNFSLGNNNVSLGNNNVSLGNNTICAGNNNICSANRNICPGEQEPCPGRKRFDPSTGSGDLR
jgi:acetyltransferase-like isoleucine patch superfamily enzyme